MTHTVHIPCYSLNLAGMQAGIRNVAQSGHTKFTRAFAAIGPTGYVKTKIHTTWTHGKPYNTVHTKIHGFHSKSNAGSSKKETQDARPVAKVTRGSFSHELTPAAPAHNRNNQRSEQKTVLALTNRILHRWGRNQGRHRATAKKQ